MDWKQVGVAGLMELMVFFQATFAAFGCSSQIKLMLISSACTERTSCNSCFKLEREFTYCWELPCMIVGRPMTRQPGVLEACLKTRSLGDISF